jgi:hypothetical protein
MPQRAARFVLAGFQRQASKTLATLQTEIAQREQELTALKTEASRWQTVLHGPARGNGAAAPKPSRRRPSRRARLDWNAIFKELPARFTSKDLAQKSGKPLAHGYAFVSRWMKDKKVRKVKDGYQKVMQVVSNEEKAQERKKEKPTKAQRAPV